MLGDRLRKGKGEEKDKWLQKWMHSCIYTVRRKAKYSSSSPSCCSILLQGRSPSRDAGWPKDAKIYLLTAHDQSMSAPRLPLLFPLVCLYMLQYSYLQGDNPALSLYNVQAYVGSCASACIQCELRPIQKVRLTLCSCWTGRYCSLDSHLGVSSSRYFWCHLYPSSSMPSLRDTNRSPYTPGDRPNITTTADVTLSAYCTNVLSMLCPWWGSVSPSYVSLYLWVCKNRMVLHLHEPREVVLQQIRAISTNTAR